MRCGWMFVVVLASLAPLGCSGGGKPAAAKKPAAESTNKTVQTAPEPQPIMLPAETEPDKVVATFLNALRTGDKATAAHLLTLKAREETAKHNIAVDPQSAPNAGYEVRPPQYLANNPNGAHVSSLWTELYQDGKVQYEIVWVLRRETEGWRVAGMAIEMVPGQEKAFLNFEDPTDMMKKRDEAIATQSPPVAETAQLPAGNAQGSAPRGEPQPPTGTTPNRLER